MKKLIFCLVLVFFVVAQSAWCKDSNLRDLFKSLDKDETYGGILTLVNVDESLKSLKIGFDISEMKVYVSNPEFNDVKAKNALKNVLTSVKASGEYSSLQEVKEEDVSVKIFLRKEGEQNKELAIIVVAVEDGEDQLVIVRITGDMSSEALQEIIKGVNI
jgi:hypothetical protein